MRGESGCVLDEEDSVEATSDHRGVGQPVSCVGLEAGGDLQFSKRSLRLSSLPSLLPDFIEVDISELEIGDSVKVGDIVLGEGIEILDPSNVMIAAVVATRVAAATVAEEVEELPEEGATEAGEKPDEGTTE